MQIEIRNDCTVIKGYVNAVGRDSRVIKSVKDTFVEQVRAGTWKKALKKNDNVALLLNHDWSKKLGSSKDILSLKEDSIGLYAEARIHNADVIKKAKNNELVGWSFGFKANKHSWGKTDDNVERRYLDDIDLFEVSILDNTRTPAYYGTSVESRDNEEIQIEIRTSENEVSIIDSTEEIENRELQVNNKKRLIEMELELINSKF